MNYLAICHKDGRIRKMLNCYNQESRGEGISTRLHYNESVSIEKGYETQQERCMHILNREYDIVEIEEWVFEAYRSQIEAVHNINIKYFSTASQDD